MAKQLQQTINQLFKLSFLSISLVTSGCGTMVFHQDLPDNYRPGNYESEKWHDTTIDGMVEISEPVNLYQECRGKPWANIEIEYTFTNGLVAFAGNSVLTWAVPALSFISPYTPWAYQVQCGAYSAPGA